MGFNDKPWLKHYDTGIPKTLEPYPAYPLFQTLRDTAQKMPDAVATNFSAKLPVVGRKKAELTYRELDEQSEALAAALLDMGIKKGDRVAMVMPNCPQFVIAFYAVLKIGGIVCATNPTYPGPKLREQFKDCGAKAVITLSLFYSTIKSIQKDTDIQHVIVSNIKDYMPPLAAFLFTLAKEKKEGHRIQREPQDHDFVTLIKQNAGRKVNVEVSPNDVAVFQYTGGTTGGLKGAVATHQALVCNLIQCKAWIGEGQELAPLMAAIPLFHVFGMVSVMMFAVNNGTTMILVPNPRHIEDVIEVIDAYKPEGFHGVPAMFNAINNHPGVQAGKYDLSSLRICISGSAPLPAVTKRKFEEYTGARLVEAFGMSEMPTATHVNPLEGDNRTGSIGLPLPDMEVRIVSLEDGVTDLGPNEVGEMIMRGPQMMAGYYNLPNETKNAMREGPDGKKWFYTGDIARMDEDGYFYIVDRKKDMALIGGFNVYPTTVEKVLAEHPAIKEVGVASIPHPDPDKVGQECLKAWVVLKPDQHVTEQELIDFAQKQLARYEVPTRIAFIDELPKTTVGKVLRRELVAKEKLDQKQSEAESVAS